MPPAESEFQYLTRLRGLAARNRVYRSFIGLGYYDCITPSVILRNVLENPGWYTPYTPYQAEIAQGRLESLLNFQTTVSDLTGMEVANASLLDEATAAAEAMTMLHRVHAKRAAAKVFLAASTCFPQTLELLTARAEPLGLELRVVSPEALVRGEVALDDKVFGLLLQTPDVNGARAGLLGVDREAHAAGVLVAVASDLLALTLLTPPGEQGADVVLGSAQRFGVPLGYGGPHAAFFATREKHVRQAPGRIIGVSVDAQGRSRVSHVAADARAAHPAREGDVEHLHGAGVAGQHGGALRGLSRAGRLEGDCLARPCAGGASRARPRGARLRAGRTRTISTRCSSTRRIRRPSTASARRADAARINLRHAPTSPRRHCARRDGDDGGCGGDCRRVRAGGGEGRRGQGGRRDLPRRAGRRTARRGIRRGWRARRRFLTHPIFNTHRSETSMMRYIRALARKDIGLDTSMIPLGSCTMKLNAASEMLPITWPEFGRLHPFAPVEQAQGYQQVFAELEASLREITGFAGISLQPNSGAQGELAGLLVIRAWHHDRGDKQRDVVLIPSSAHGTNPASAVLAGMQVVVTACDAQGNVDVAELRKAKAEQHEDRLCGADGDVSVDARRLRGCDPARSARSSIEHGGQVYMDGANMNAQVGLTSPALIGADVCHLNLHKTFAIPHGGGGPGMGPIGVAEHLAPYPAGAFGGADGRSQGDSSAVSAAPWGSASILLISHAYTRMLGPDGMTDATQGGDSERELHQGAARGALSDSLHAHERARGARDDRRPAAAEAGVGHRRVGRREAADGLRLPRADHLVPGAGHADDRADRERSPGRARPLLRRADRHPRGNPGGHRRHGRQGRTTSSRTRRTRPRCRWPTSGRTRTRVSRRSSRCRS